VWRAIRSRVQAARAPRAPFGSSLGLWRGLAFASTAVVIVLAALLLRIAPERAEGAVIAVLAAKDARATLVASADRFGRYLTIKAIERIDIPPDRTLQLWMLPAAGNPQSLGVIDTATVARVALSAPADEALRNVPALAVSLEPRGGSPTGLPTGPVLFSGPVQRTY
jgi:anti-sigma-K factor RskA